MHRAIEAELWGVYEEVHVEDGLTISKTTGTFGCLYEIECTSLWRFWRLHAILALLPAEATYRYYPGPPVRDEDEDDEEDDDSVGVFAMHYWEDTRDHVRASRSGGTAAQIRKPTD